MIIGFDDYFDRLCFAFLDVDLQFTGVVVSVSARNSVTVRVEMKWQIFGQHNLNDDDVVGPGGKPFFSVSSSIGLNAPSSEIRLAKRFLSLVLRNSMLPDITEEPSLNVTTPDVGPTG